MHGTLYVVATPIGNLEDITLRALRVLGACDVVLCEDTRVTKKLLSHYDIDTPCMSYHEHSGTAKLERVEALLADGKDLALVTDAGTPTVSDPGARLVDYVLQRLPEVRVQTVPGPSAVAAALSVAGVPADSFVFAGFPPHKKGRKTFFDTVAARSEAVVLYESPHRALKAFSALAERLQSERLVVVCRELTKLHEEVVRGSAAEVLEHFEEHADTVRGEFVIIVAPPQ